jgi:hypothetical protein
MRGPEIADRALADPQWGAELAKKAAAAARAGSGRENLRGPEWTALLSELAESPEDLGRMVSELELAAFPTTTTTTTTVTGTSLTVLAVPETTLVVTLVTIAVPPL